MGKNQLSCLAESRRGTRTRASTGGKRNHRSARHAKSRTMACLPYTEQTGQTWWLFDPECMETDKEEGDLPCG